MTMYINKNFRTRNVWIKKRGGRSSRNVYLQNLFRRVAFYDDAACMSLSLSNINIRSHSLYVFHSPWHHFYHFYESFVLPYIALFFLLRSSANRKTAGCFFFFSFNRVVWALFACITVAHAVLPFYRIPATFLSLKRRAADRASLRPLLLFWRRRRTRRIDENLTSDHRALTSSRLENAWRYFCARTASSMYFHISAVGLFLSRALSPDSPPSPAANDSRDGRTCIRARTREYGINERFLPHLKTHRVMLRILIRSTLAFTYNRCLFKATMCARLSMFLCLSSHVFCLEKFHRDSQNTGYRLRMYVCCYFLLLYVRIILTLQCPSFFISYDWNWIFTEVKEGNWKYKK